MCHIARAFIVSDRIGSHPTNNIDVYCKPRNVVVYGFPAHLIL